jgi:LysR family glycine cleavage system transcriptional activator
MAMNGIGVALVPDFLAERELAAGRLALLAPGGLPTDEDYYLCMKRARRNEPGLQAIERWFKAQANGKSMA